MQLKVGDKVRWIGSNELGRIAGMRGEVISIDKSQLIDTCVDWENGDISYCRHQYLIKEFQPGDRVVRNEPGAPDVPAGSVGMVVNKAPFMMSDFAVRWEHLQTTVGYCYADNCVAHRTTYHPTARTPTLPPPPPDPPRPPDRSQYGRCYFCGAGSSEWLRDRYTCDDCMERYR